VGIKSVKVPIGLGTVCWFVGWLGAFERAFTFNNCGGSGKTHTYNVVVFVYVCVEGVQWLLRNFSSIDWSAIFRIFVLSQGNLVLKRLGQS